VGALRSYDPFFETPDEGGMNGPPGRGSIHARVKPSGVQLAVPSRRILLELRLRPRRCYLCRRVHWARRCTPRPDQVSSLSSAMGLTTILTTIWVVHRNTHKRKILISKENWTSEDVGGHAADV